MSARCQDTVLQALAVLARLGWPHHVVAWLSHHQAEPLEWLRGLGYAALAQLEANDRTGAGTTLTSAAAVLEGQPPRPDAAPDAVAAVQAIVASEDSNAANKRWRTCRETTRGETYGLPDIRPFLMLGEVAAALDDQRAGQFFNAAVKAVQEAEASSWRRQFGEIPMATRLRRLGEIAVAEARAGLLQRACQRLESIPLEAGRIETLIDIAMAVWTRSARP